MRLEKTVKARCAAFFRRAAACIGLGLAGLVSAFGQAPTLHARAGQPAMPPFSLTNFAAEQETIAGPAWSDFRLTLDLGVRQEAAGPFFYAQQTDSQRLWALPPFFSYSQSLDQDARESEFLYPLFTWRRFGTEYRGQIMQLFNFSGGKTQAGPDSRLFTLFPFYFQRRSAENPDLNYTALAPFYGHLQNRLFHDDIKFALFPLYAKTREKDVVTDNYLWPIFDARSGGHVSGWQFWPVVGTEHKPPTLSTNILDEVETNGGYDHLFAAWPFFLKEHSGVGTTNPLSRLVAAPFYSRLRSPLRDEDSYGWPFGYWRTDDRGKQTREQDFLWPLFEFAQGQKNVTRIFPFYSKAAGDGIENDFYLWPVYKYLRLEAPGIVRERTRIAFFLYSDTREKYLENGARQRRVDFWPLFSYQREKDQKQHLHALALLEPFFPGNPSIEREYSQVWSLWRAEKDAKTGVASQSLLWNLYRRESGPASKKYSLLFGLFQYQSGGTGANWRVCYIPLGKKKENQQETVRQ